MGKLYFSKAETVDALDSLDQIAEDALEGLDQIAEDAYQS